MVDVSKIRASPDIATLRDAVADAFLVVSSEQTNSQKIADLEARLVVVEAKP